VSGLSPVEHYEYQIQLRTDPISPKLERQDVVGWVDSTFRRILILCREKLMMIPEHADPLKFCFRRDIQFSIEYNYYNLVTVTPTG